jgi:hypothetical protein
MNAELFADALALHMENWHTDRLSPEVDCGTHPTRVISEDEARFIAIVSEPGKQFDSWTVTLKREP